MTRAVAILLVEDDKAMLHGMQDILQVIDLGYDLEILTAGNGVEALQILENHTPDLIISDVMMPLMDGFQFLHRLQEKPEWANIPFIFLSARGEKEEIYQGRLSAAVLYITKPFQTVEFLELIKTHLDRKLELERIREQHINSLKKGVLQILNHEFRTPLTYVTAYYEMLADSVNTYAGTDNFQEYLRGIQAGCLRLTRLIESFILVVELRSGEAQRKFEQRACLITDMAGLLREVAEANRGRAAQQGLALVYTPDPNLPAVWGDPLSLKLVFQQLLDNAIKFSSRRLAQRTETAVILETAVRQGELVIAFKDAGVGLPPHMQQRVFDLFVQYNRDQLEQQGAGAGLTIAQGLTQLHQGRIELQSEENVGSTFSVVLPIQQGAVTNNSGNERAKKAATVLIVEDEQYLLEGLRELLSIYDVPYDLTVLTANNGRQGLLRLAEQTPDIIISDIMMPFMDGYTFLSEVRKNPDWLQIPFIFLTARGERGDVHRGLRSGVEEYITKPYESDELMGLIVKQLDRHFQMKQVMSRSFDALKRGIIELITPDFQVPLASVARYSDELESQIGESRTEEELKASLQGIQAGSIRLSRLVEDFISLAELKTGEAEIAYQLRATRINDIGYLLYEAGLFGSQMTAPKSLELVCPLLHDLPPVQGDRVMLMESLRRLLELGLSYYKQPVPGRIAYSVAQTEKEVQLVLDFPFQLSAAEVAAMEGALEQDETHDLAVDRPPGLSIVQGYMGLHNGRLQFDQTADSFTFRLVLPIALLAQPESGL